MSLIYTHQKSKLSKKQRAAREALLKEQRAIKRSLKVDASAAKLTSHATYRRDTGPAIKSLPFSGAPCTKPIEGNRYTGTAMIGIGTLHKSNAVPVFSSDDAKEISRMRRG